MYFLASIRYTKSLGNAAIYVRLRDGAGNYWDWTSLVWSLTNTAPTRFFLVEEPDSSPTDSRYVGTVDIPALTYSTILEYVDVSTGDVIGEDTILAQSVPSQGLSLPQRVKLGARLLTDVGSVNVFTPTTVLEWMQGDRPIFFFQLVDTSVDQKFNPPYRRWVPPILTSGQNMALAVEVTDIDTGVSTIAVAAQPFIQDSSIFQVDIFENLTQAQVDAYVGTYALRLLLESGPTYTADAVTPNPTPATLLVNEDILTTTPATGHIYVNGERLEYLSWSGKTFTFDVAPVMVANATLWAVTPPVVNGFCGQALSISPIRSEF